MCQYKCFVSKFNGIVNKITSMFVNDLFIKHLLLLSSCLAVIVIITTIVDLAINYSFHSTKEGFITLLDAFNWEYISPFFVILSAYIALSTYRTHEKNMIYNNIVRPKVEVLDFKLNQIKEQNLQIYTHFIYQGKQIVSDIIFNEKERCINSKERLNHYFINYITKEQITNFEKCGFHYDGCKIKSTCIGELSCRENITVTYHGKTSHSLFLFKIIAYELFCVSYTYTDFERDIEKLYTDNIDSLR